ncbi:MAG TPA: GFA family protein, partial [Burkholderiales bacterium]|nr:GFA family protein [Burkholderiales bacterium]
WESTLAQDKTYNGSCFCGTVQFTVSGEPAAMGYCHCESCRTWSAGPVNAFTLWKPESLRVTKGADKIGNYAKTPNSQRKWCKSCGGHLFTDHPQWNLVDVYAAVIPGFPYKPGVHVNYQETKLHIRDGLPKMKDLPKEMGGSGLALAE